ncbi:MAG TPA: hypothetical protein VLM85_08930 [Polyangiaceae bacterium]|nr:hypothetical protein [Polyangiaceae bacterium]
MADLPPVSDPQLAQILAQNKSRRRRAVFIFTAVALVLAVGLGGSGLYFSAQAKKKRNVAYSRVIKCLFGTPLQQGEVPMTRVRAAWRARIFAAKAPGMKEETMEEQEAQKASEWPNRCVPEMIAFTDTLKDIGEMKEGDKDLGFYSRELSKQTAGDNWKNVDTYQAAVESFVSEADKGQFQFVDVPGVTAPDTLGAEPIDALFPKSSAAEGLRVDLGARETVAGSTVRFYLQAGHGKPARLCETADGKALTCGEVMKGGLPPEASGRPWMLGSADGAPSLLAYGFEGGIASGSSVAVGVFRSGDGLRLVKSGEYYVAGGFARADGSALLLLKESAKPEGDRFKLARLAPGATEPAYSDVDLTGWDGQPWDAALLGDRIVWIDTTSTLKSRSADAPQTVQTLATLPGVARGYGRTVTMRACATKSGVAIAVPTEADGAPRELVAFATDGGGWGKAEVVEAGTISCGDDALYVVSSSALTECTPQGCKSEPRTERQGTSVALDGVVVTTEVRKGLLRLTWEKGKTQVASKVYDAQMKGTVLLGESKLGGVELIPRRGYGLIVANVGDQQHFARIDPGGTVSATALKEN